jgi:hypothetical protein
MKSILWEQCFLGQLHSDDKEKVVANGIKVFFKKKRAYIAIF